jgi:hypothetical protein
VCAPARNNISKSRDAWQLAYCAVRCNAVILRWPRGAPIALSAMGSRRGPRRMALSPFEARLRSHLRVTLTLFSDRIQRPGSRLRTSAASRPFPWTAPPFAIAALQTSAPRPSGAALDLRLCCSLAGRKAKAGWRNLLRDWQARDNAAPAGGSIRRIRSMTYFWPTARTWPPEPDNAAPSLCDRPSLAPPPLAPVTLLGGSAVGQGACG